GRFGGRGAVRHRARLGLRCRERAAAVATPRVTESRLRIGQRGNSTPRNGGRGRAAKQKKSFPSDRKALARFVEFEPPAKMPSVLVIGSLNMDLVVETDSFPRPGETLRGTDFATHPGGKGANQAVAAARLGARVTMVGRVGGDAFGRELKGVLGA